MTTKNRLTKRNLRVPIRFNDHIMSNLSQNGSKTKTPKDNEEFRVQDDRDKVGSKELGMNKMREDRIDCDRNGKPLNDCMNDSECELNDGAHRDIDVQTESNECLDNSGKMDNEELVMNGSNNVETLPSVKTSYVDLSVNQEFNSKSGSKKTYASATKNREWSETNKLLFVPTMINELCDNRRFFLVTV
ncbi:hypothetical protein Tco_0331150 [Tanacetum coccineum]